MKKWENIFLILLPIAVLILGAVPTSQVMKFVVPGQPEEFRLFYDSYYSAVHAEFGNWCGLLTMGLAGVLLAVYSFLSMWNYIPLRLVAPLIGCAATAASLINVLYGSMTGIGWWISGLLLLQTILAFVTRKKV